MTMAMTNEQLTKWIDEIFGTIDEIKTNSGDITLISRTVTQHGHQIQELQAETEGPEAEEKASIITIEDAAPIDALEVITDIKVSQSGTGDPSPTNIRSIQGSDEAIVRACGKNLFDKSTSVTESRFDATGTISYLSGFSRSQFIRCKEGTTYYFKDVLSANNFSAVWWYDKDFVNVGYNAFSGDSDKASGTATAPSGAYYVGINFKESVKDTVCLYESGASDGEYLPYEEHTITASFGRTIYAGSANITTGALTETMAGADMGSLTWTYSTSGDLHLFTAEDLASILAEDPQILCSIFKPVAFEDLADMCIAVDSSGNVVAACSTYDDASDFTTAVDDQIFCYELATAGSYTADPTPVTLLEGINNITSSTGDLSVTYAPNNVLANIYDYIQKMVASLRSAISALDARVYALEHPTTNSTTTRSTKKK